MRTVVALLVGLAVGAGFGYLASGRGKDKGKGTHALLAERLEAVVELDRGMLKRSDGPCGASAIGRSVKTVETVFNWLVAHTDAYESPESARFNAIAKAINELSAEASRLGERCE